MVVLHATMVVLDIGRHLTMVTGRAGMHGADCGRRNQLRAWLPSRCAGNESNREGANEGMPKNATHPMMLAEPVCGRQQMFFAHTLGSELARLGMAIGGSGTDR
jgi:hypothetical protein